MDSSSAAQDQHVSFESVADWAERTREAERRELVRLRRENERLRSRDCRTCGGLGTIEGFLLGTVKTCPACKGRGTRG